MDGANRRSRTPSIGVESLECRAVLSTASPATAPLHAALVQGVGNLNLRGSAHGAANTVVGTPDVGSAVMVHGSGRFPGLGPMDVTGYFHGTGFTANGGITGSVTLSNAKGSVTLGLQGPSAPGFTAPTSGTYRFTIQDGTGIHAHEIGSGTVDVAFKANAFRLTFHGKPNRY